MELNFNTGINGARMHTSNNQTATHRTQYFRGVISNVVLTLFFLAQDIRYSIDSSKENSRMQFFAEYIAYRNRIRSIEKKNEAVVLPAQLKQKSEMVHFTRRSNSQNITLCITLSRVWCETFQMKRDREGEREKLNYSTYVSTSFSILMKTSCILPLRSFNPLRYIKYIQEYKIENKTETWHVGQMVKQSIKRTYWEKNLHRTKGFNAVIF